MKLSPEQYDALLKFLAWYYDPNRSPIFTILGYAGTGKSTLIKYLIEAIEVEPSRVAYVTYTGKASLVLRRKGHNAITIHRLIYVPKLSSYTDERTGVIKTRVSGFVLRTELEWAIDLIVIDEVSMVSRELLIDLLSFNIPIVCLGDPGQLPPVRGHGHGLAKTPDVFLRTVHRQAAENPIIWASMLAREGRPIPYGVHGDNLLVLRRHQADPQHAMTAHQILVCTHETRKAYNNAIRRIKGYTDPLPYLDEKLVCRKNSWDLVADDGMPMVNGTIGRVYWQRGFVDERERTIIIGLEQEDNQARFPLADCNLDFFDPLPGSEPDTGANVVHLEYGYAITTHRSQGSEWPSVWAVNDGFGSDTNRRQLLYTEITRAQDYLVLCT